MAKKKKNNSKKYRSIIISAVLGALIIALIAVLLINTGCEGLAGGGSSTTAGIATTTTEETPVPVLVETDSNGQPIETAEGGGNGVEIDHTILIENNECKVTVLSVDVANANGFSVNVLLENKSENDTFIFSVEYATVDGLTIDPFWASTVEPGKSAQSTISFTDKNLDPSIKFTDILMLMKVNTEAEWESKSIAEQIIHVYPYGEESKETYQRADAATDILLVENDNISFKVVNCSYNEVWGYSVKVYIENKTDKDLFFSASDVTIIGKNCDPNWGVLIPAHSTGYSSMLWDNETLISSGVSQDTEISFTLIATDNADWASAAYTREKITFNP